MNINLGGILSHQDAEIKSRILALINECKTIIDQWQAVLYPASDSRMFSEEDTKLKLIYPLFEVLGWNLKDHRETETESCKEYDETLEKKFLKKWPTHRLQSLKMDCVFKLNNKPHICLEAKHLSQKILPSLDTLQGERTVAYARKWGAKYVVFTNFVKMEIIKIDKEQQEPKVLASFNDMNDYISQFDKLKILARPAESSFRT